MRPTPESMLVLVFSLDSFLFNSAFSSEHRSFKIECAVAYSLYVSKSLVVLRCKFFSSDNSSLSFANSSLTKSHSSIVIINVLACSLVMHTRESFVKPLLKAAVGRSRSIANTVHTSIQFLLVFFIVVLPY